MLLKISTMPEGIKLCKILTFDKITKKSSYIDGFPKPGELIDNTLKMSKETALSESVPVPVVSEALMNACWRMVRACLADDGVGLAACQIGVMKRFFIIRENEEYFKVYFHPKYSSDINSKIEIELEGCLSVPGKKFGVPRHSVIFAEWLEINSEGKLVSRNEIINGYKARIYQHEFSHIEGRSIVQDSQLKIPFSPK